MLKPLLAASLMLVNVSATYPDPDSAIPKVTCRIEDGTTAGSAVRVSKTYLVTAGHVIEGRCEIDGQPIKIAYKSRKADFAILEDTRPGAILKVDCKGYVAGREYEAVGHARGRDNLTTVILSGLGFNYKSTPTLSMLTGIFTVQPGQSGGAVKSRETGWLVGIVNTGDWGSGISGSIELKRTSICGGHDA
jgi:hypothetical protein